MHASKTLLKTFAAAVLTATALWATPSFAGKTLDTIKERGAINCGVNVALAGFSMADSSGKWTGLDVDFCHAVAAALLGDANKVKYVPLSAQQRFTALQSGEVDLLSRNTTWTMSRDTQMGLVFAGVTYYDGQGFMVTKKSKITSAKKLANTTVCVQSGTTTEKNLADFFRSNKMPYKPVVIEDFAASVKAFVDGRCGVYTTDASGLAAIRANDVKNPDDYVILPELISKEPLGPVVRRGDDEWFSLVKWTYYALLNAEEAGITSANIDEFKTSADPNVKRLLGIGEDFGKSMGVSADWAYQAIKQAGNYGEIFERNVGEKTPLKLKRGLNALWSNGGLQYGMPVR